ncbi:MAG: NlpC/P60 family protein [Calditrichaeota bacterium]|nr:MAG: NlpC/P60 family protein [Calditrichota bacterium]
MYFHFFYRTIFIVFLVNMTLMLTGCLRPKPSYVPHNDVQPQASHTLADGNDGDTGVTNAPSQDTEQFSNGMYPLSSSMVARNLANVLVPFLDTPYKYGGESTKGVDCSGLVRMVYLDGFQIDLPHKASYQFNLGKAVSKNRLVAGDLVFFYGERGRDIGHVGIFLSEGRFIHSMAKRGVVISYLQEGYWKKYYAGARRIFGAVKPDRPVPAN